ncbi:hypothetical protein FB451DRAFT_1164723 [Mycena latifolia]|nr:hypothetical protein FB451DRAFT_1164723 [Mycena latifolia]
MPPQPTVAQIRFSNTVQCLSSAGATLEVISTNLKAPFLEPISNTTRSLLAAVQVVKRNRDDCTQMLEQVHELIYGIIHLHITSATAGELSPNMLNHLEGFMETLRKIHTFVEAQQEKNRIKQFFRQVEMNILLRDCHLGLEKALEVFKFQGLRISSDMSEMQKYAQKTHNEVLELISASWDGWSDTESLISGHRSSFQSSEVSTIVQMFSMEGSPRIAILGAGGMGKTSLARAVLHHPEIAAKYNQHRVFIPCDAAASTVQLAAIIGEHVGLKPGTDLTQPVVRHFASNPPSLLILDNLETIWEPRQLRSELENFLSFLAAIDHLALVITMRGAERPANIQWTRPFVEPLKPLLQYAARQTFIDIADDGYSPEDVDKILLMVDNMPLAIDLMAHLVDCEGLPSVLQRWEMDKTSVLSQGYDKGSNLDLSISLSLASPRIISLPQAQDLLSLLSVLPDGISDTELVQSRLSIDNILACKATLLQTSLAYTDSQRRLKALVPIREYIGKHHPAMAYLLQPLLKYFSKLLERYGTSRDTVSSPGMIARITANFANIQNILVKSLNRDNPDLVDAIYCTCHFDYFSRLAGRGRIQLMDQIPGSLPRPCDYRLEVFFIVSLIAGNLSQSIANAEHLVDQALGYFSHFDDPDLKCRFYAEAAEFYMLHSQNISRAMHFFQAGLSLSISTGNNNRQAQLLDRLALIEWRTGDYSGAQVHAYESQRLARISGDFYREATALRLEAVCWILFGSYNNSIALCQRAGDLLRLCGMSGGDLDLVIMNTKAEAHRLKSEYIEAHNIQTQILRIISIEQEPYHYASALLNIAQLDVEMSASKQDVQRNIDMAHSGFTAINLRMALTNCDAVRAALALRQGNLLVAKTLFEQSLGCAWGQDGETVTYCLERLSDVHQWKPVGQTSYTWTVTFLVYALRNKQKLEINKGLQFLGDLHLAADDRNTAIGLFTVALEGFTCMDIHRSKAECMLHLGDIAAQDGSMTKAIELWKMARPLFERSSQKVQVAHIDERLTESGILDQQKPPRKEMENEIRRVPAFRPEHLDVLM